MQKKKYQEQSSQSPIQEYKENIRILFPQINKQNIKHLQNSSMDNIVITQIFELIFSDSYLYTHSQLIQKIQNNRNGYLQIVDLLKMQSVQQLIQVCDLYHKLPLKSFIDYVRISIQQNSKLLKCNNTSIRRKLPFINNLRKCNKIYFQPFSHTTHASQYQVQQLVGYVSSFNIVYKAEYQLKYDFGYLFLQSSVRFLQQQKNFKNDRQHLVSNFDQKIRKKWSFYSYQNLPKMKFQKRNLFSNQSIYKSKYKKAPLIDRKIQNYEQLRENQLFQNDKSNTRQFRNKRFMNIDETQETLMLRVPNFEFNYQFFKQEMAKLQQLKQYCKIQINQQLRQRQQINSFSSQHRNSFNSQQSQQIHQYQC